MMLFHLILKSHRLTPPWKEVITSGAFILAKNTVLLLLPSLGIFTKHFHLLLLLKLWLLSFVLVLAGALLKLGLLSLSSMVVLFMVLILFLLMVIVLLPVFLSLKNKIFL